MKRLSRKIDRSQILSDRKKLSFWKAPSDLEPESFKNPSAKRLSRKGEKLHDNLYK